MPSIAPTAAGSGSVLLGAVVPSCPGAMVPASKALSLAVNDAGGHARQEEGTLTMTPDPSRIANDVAGKAGAAGIQFITWVMIVLLVLAVVAACVGIGLWLAARRRDVERKERGEPADVILLPEPPPGRNEATPER